MYNSEHVQEHGSKTDKKGGAAGAVEGAFIGCGAATIMITIGLLLCLTGIGALIGIPLILAGLMMPFAAALKGSQQITGPCPHCGNDVTFSPSDAGVTCPSCHARLPIIDKVG